MLPGLSFKRSRAKIRSRRSPQTIVPLFVDCPDSIRVAVVCNPDVRAMVLHGLNEILEVFDDGGIRMMVGETAVEVVIQSRDATAQLLQNVFRHQTRGAVSAIEYDVHSLSIDTGKVFLEITQVGRDDRGRGHGSRSGRIRPGLDQTLEFLNVFAIQRRFIQTHFEAVVFGRIVAPGDHHASVNGQLI